MRRLISFLSSPKIFLITIFWLMILVVIGTLSQASIGLYESQQKYFSSWIMWGWKIPFPGGRLTLLVMFINLFSFTLKPTFWSIKKIGIIVIHCGVLLLLVGGGVTAWFSSEGMMSIDEGKSSNFIFSLYDKELAIINSDNLDSDSVIVISDKALKKGAIIESDEIPFTIEVIDYFVNCIAVFRDNPTSDYKGFSQRFSLVRIENEKERELNHTGITFKISNSNDKSVDGIYSLMLEQNIPQTISIKVPEEFSDDNSNGKFDEGESFKDTNLNGQWDATNELVLNLRRERTYLPFSLYLKPFINQDNRGFKKEMHPDTDIPKSFSSDIILNSESVDRSVIIEMNAPLRYQNYTFYQSAFRENPNSNFDTTILSVVKNSGRLFPYISTIIMSVGLLLHMVIRLPKLFSEKKKRNK